MSEGKLNVGGIIEPVEILKVFCEVQHNTMCHKDNMRLLEEYLEEVGFDTFAEEFLHVLLYLQLNAYYKAFNAYYDRVLTFSMKFLASYEKLERPEEESLVTVLLNGVIKFHSCSNDILRYRICEFINVIFNNEDPVYTENLDEELVERIKDALFERITDLNLPVRIKAINILQFMQEPDNDDCKVINNFICNLTSSYSKVRLEIIKFIAANEKTIHHILFRVRDVDEKVRIATYKKFVEIPCHLLNISQRHNLLTNGNNDVCNNIKNIIKEKILPEWLKSFDYNYIELVQGMIIDSSQKEMLESMKYIEMILNTLFPSQNMATILEQLDLKNKLLQPSEMTYPHCLYWRCLITYLRTTKGMEQFLEQIFPDSVTYCDFVMNYYHSKVKSKMEQSEHNNFQMVLLELITIAIDCDISDECSRLRVKEMLVSFLKENISTEIVAKIFVFLNRTIPVVDRRIDFICELLSDIRTPLEPEFDPKKYEEYEKKTTDLRYRIHKLQDDQRNAINEENFELAETIKSDIIELRNEITALDITQTTEEQQCVRKNDPETVLKCVNIVIELLQSPQVHKLNNALRTLRNDLLQDIITIKVPTIQAKIMKCYALCSYFDEEGARNSISLIGGALLAYREKSFTQADCILVSAINGIVDIIMLFGPDIFPTDTRKPGERKNKVVLPPGKLPQATFIEVIQILVSMMDDKRLKIREAAVIGIIKILGSAQIASTTLLSRLVLKWFNPATERDIKLHQHLGVFLINCNREPHIVRQLQGTFIPTLRVLGNAPPTSPLRRVNGEKVAKFLVHLTEPKIIGTVEIHQNVAETLCLAIESDIYDMKANALYAKTLLLLDLVTCDEDFLETLLAKCEDLIDELEDVRNSTVVTNNIRKLFYRLKSYCTGYLYNAEIPNDDANNSRST